MKRFVKEFLLAEDVKVLPAVALCLGLLGTFFIVIVFLGSAINGDYYGDLLPTALWLIGFACGLWVLHVIIDTVMENIDRRKQENDPTLNSISVDFVEDDRYSDWEHYHRSQTNNGK